MKEVLRIEIPQTFQADLAALATEQPLTPRAHEARQKELETFKAVMSQKALLERHPTFGQTNQALQKLRSFATMYKEAISGTEKQYAEVSKKDPRVLFGLFPRYIFGTKESNEVLERKRILEAHSRDIGALLKKAEAANGALLAEKSKLVNRQLTLSEKREMSIATMNYKLLADGLVSFDKMKVTINGVKQNGPHDLFKSLSSLLRLGLSDDAFRVRVATFIEKLETAPETIDGPTADLQVLKYCTKACYDHLVLELQNACEKHRTSDKKPYFIPVNNADAQRDIAIKTANDGSAEIRLESQIALKRPGKPESVANVTGSLVVKLGIDGKTTMKCHFNNVVPLDTADIYDERKLARVFAQEAKVSAPAKS